MTTKLLYVLCRVPILPLGRIKNFIIKQCAHLRAHYQINNTLAPSYATDPTFSLGSTLAAGLDLKNSRVGGLGRLGHPSQEVLDWNI